MKNGILGTMFDLNDDGEMGFFERALELKIFNELMSDDDKLSDDELDSDDDDDEL